MAVNAHVGDTVAVVDPNNPGQQMKVNADGTINVSPSTGGTTVIGVGTGTTGAVVGTMPAVAGKTNYIAGFDVSAIGGTAAVGPIVLAGLLGGSFTYELASSVAGVIISRSFTPPLPASAVNTAITVTTTADGTASAVAVNVWGYVV